MTDTINADEYTRLALKKTSKLGRGKWKRNPRPIEDRFWEKVDKSGECWIWTACTDGHGYGVMSVPGGYTKAHILSYRMHVGEIPRGLCVLHKCDNPRCVNPDHLFLGTRRDNALDRDRKGRVAHGESHYAAKLTNKQVREIRERWDAGGVRIIELARDYGVNDGNIEQIVKRKTWRRVS